MRRLKTIITTTLWSLLALYVAVLVLIHLPYVQRAIGQQVAHAVASKLGTQVSVGKVDMGFFNRLVIDDVLIYDQQQKEMVKARRLTAKVELLPLLDGKVRISSAQLFGAQVTCRQQDANSAPNFQFALDSLASKDTTSHTPLDLRINSLIMRHSSISYDRNDVAPTKTFNPHHLHLRDISAHISLKAFTDDSLNINIRRLSFNEQSGLNVKKLALKLEANQREARLSDLQLRLPGTDFRIGEISARYKLDGKRLIPASLHYQGEISDTYLTPADISFLVPALTNFKNQLSVAVSFYGTSTSVTVDKARIYDNELSIAGKGFIKNWETTPDWIAEVEHLSLTAKSIEDITKNLNGENVQIPEMVNRLGAVTYQGTLTGTGGHLYNNSLLTTDIGTAHIHVGIGQDRTFEGQISTDDINLQRLLDNPDFGIVATKIHLNGTLPRNGTPTVNATGSVQQLDYLGYSYHQIELNGTYSANDITGELSVNDPNAKVHVHGSVSKGAKSVVKVQGNVGRLAPASLHLSDRWGDALFSAAIDADFTATSINDAVGYLNIQDFAMLTEDGSNDYRMNSLHVESGFNESTHFVRLDSDFANAMLTGKLNYGTLAQSLVNFVGSKLPTLPGLPPVSKVADNDFAVSLKMSKSDWLQRLLGIDLSISQPLALQAIVNDNTHIIHLDSDLPAFTYNGGQYERGHLRLTTPGDTLRCDANLTKLMDDGEKFDWALTAHAINNHLTTGIRFDNNLENEEKTSGNINCTTQLYRNLSGQPEAAVEMLPSHLIFNNSVWGVEPSTITYYKNHLTVDNFTIRRDNQHIIINGVASDNANDLLTIDLNDIEVAYILDLVNFHSVAFAGEATGKAQISAPFGDFDASADLIVNHFTFERGRMGVLHANAQWNKEEKQIDIHGICNDGPEALTFIDGYISPVRDFIDLDIRAEGTYLDFMHNFTQAFISQITGHAQGAVRLAGPLSTINLTGKLVVDGEATITPLNTTYYLRKDTITLIPDDILLDSIVVYDRYDHTGILSGGIHHKHLTRLSYDLEMQANNFLSYDFKEFGENTFYGTVFATGDVDIHGKSGELVINANATPEENTVFVYNVAQNETVNNQQFITWNDATAYVRQTDSTATDNPANHAVALRRMLEDIPSDIYLNFRINANPRAAMRLLMDSQTGDYITLRGNGMIQANFHNKGSFNMFGTYTVEQGTYGITIQNIIKKDFVFNDGGTLIFSGDPFDANLNLQAVHTVNSVSLSDLNIGNSFSNNTIRVNCLMNISGQANSPHVDFDLEMPTVNAEEQAMVRSVINGQQEMNQQVLYLLGIGRFYAQGNNNASTQNNQDQTTLAMQSFLSGTLSTQINSLLNNVIKSNNWNFGANISTGTEGWNNAEYEGLVSGSMLNNRLLINGQFGYRDNATTTANPSFIGDFDIRYLLLPNGNLALKVYNQSNDRYFTRSTLNTQGIGLIIKRDFNGLGDLFGSKKKKKEK